MLVWQKAEGDEEREDRDGCLGDARHRGVDVLLAPGDEPERQCGVEHAEHERRPPRGSEPRRVGAASRPHEEGEQQDARHGHLADIITLGSRSSTATLMKKYELPQSPASSSSQGT